MLYLWCNTSTGCFWHSASSYLKFMQYQFFYYILLNSRQLPNYCTLLHGALNKFSQPTSARANTCIIYHLWKHNVSCLGLGPNNWLHPSDSALISERLRSTNFKQFLLSHIDFCVSKFKSAFFCYSDHVNLVRHISCHVMSFGVHGEELCNAC